MQDKQISEVLLDPLNHPTNILALKNFMQLIKSSIGPHGKLKLIQNSAGGHVVVTSSSIRLYDNLSIKNIFLRFIISSAKSLLKNHNDGGLYCVFLTLRLLDNALQLPYSKHLTGQIFENIGNVYISCYDSEAKSCSFNIDFSGLSQMEALATSVIKSKPACILSENSQKHLCLLLLKSFLHIIPCIANPKVYKSSISFHTLEGLNSLESKLYDGLLIRYSEILRTTTQEPVNTLKVVLFSVSLSGDAELPVTDIEEKEISVWEEVFKLLQELVNKLINDKVDVVACQKVVHPTLKKQLEDSEIFVLDRLGAEASKHLQYITGTEAVLSLSSNMTYGSLSSVEHLVIGKKNFLLLNNSSTPFQTILICNYNEEAVNETKVVCQQVFDSLYYLLKKPAVCFGGGCTEMYMVNALKIKMNSKINDVAKEFGCPKSQVLKIFQAFLRSIVDVAVSIHQDSWMAFATESVHNHLWKLQNSDFPVGSMKCMCGQYSADCVPSTRWKLLSALFPDHLTIEEAICEMPVDVPEPQLIVKESVLLDLVSCKRNASFMALETASILLRTSVYINSSG